MNKPFTFIYFKVYTKKKSSFVFINENENSLNRIYSKCSTALNFFSVKPDDKVVNKILKQLDL
jgi:hypothetical protein